MPDGKNRQAMNQTKEKNHEVTNGKDVTMTEINQGEYIRIVWIITIYFIHRHLSGHTRSPYKRQDKKNKLRVKNTILNSKNIIKS